MSIEDSLIREPSECSSCRALAGHIVVGLVLGLLAWGLMPVAAAGDGFTQPVRSTAARASSSPPGGCAISGYSGERFTVPTLVKLTLACASGDPPIDCRWTVDGIPVSSACSIESHLEYTTTFVATASNSGGAAPPLSVTVLAANPCSIYHIPQSCFITQTPDTALHSARPGTIVALGATCQIPDRARHCTWSISASQECFIEFAAPEKSLTFTVTPFGECGASDTIVSTINVLPDPEKTLDVPTLGRGVFGLLVLAMLAAGVTAARLRAA